MSRLPRRIRPTGDLYHRVLPSGAIYVGRPTRWGNPHAVGKPCKPCQREHLVGEAIELYRQHIRDRPDLIQRARTELRGRDLACWCPLSQPCHADFLIVVANPQGGDPLMTTTTDEGFEPYTETINLDDPAQVRAELVSLVNDVSPVGLTGVSRADRIHALGRIGVMAARLVWLEGTQMSREEMELRFAAGTTPLDEHR